MLGKKAKEVLNLLQEYGLLDDIILIGSWCGHFYQIYFGKKNYSPNIQTLDIDFLVPPRVKFKGPKLDGLLHDLDFEEEITPSGWVRFVHPELRVEFLVPRLCNQSDEPRVISKINISAMPLRHLAVLT
ncbi:MAG: GSU2403 family nucleotidyltransferase fold protein, partial [bacterium]